jgi:undecaprenyl-diphosphatase
MYWRKFFDFAKWQFYVKLIVAFIPAAICGALLSKQIDALLESSFTVGMSFLIGGIVLLFVDKIFKNGNLEHEREISYPKAFLIGCFQVLAMIPGVSRSAATIVGGLQQKLNRKLATEFSFYLTIPTMTAASAKKLWDFYKTHDHQFAFEQGQLGMLIAGNIIAFIVAFIAIKTFIAYVQKHTFRAFGVYRIIAGIAVLALIGAGIIKKNETKSEVPAKQPSTLSNTINNKPALAKNN